MTLGVASPHEPEYSGTGAMAGSTHGDVSVPGKRGASGTAGPGSSSDRSDGANRYLFEDNCVVTALDIGMFATMYVVSLVSCTMLSVVFRISILTSP